MQGKKEYAEKLFTNFQLSERVPKDNFYRKLKETLDLEFLYKETKKYYGSEGQQSIDPVVFFKLILVGYLENQNSDRKIINHVSMRMDILYFIDYDIDDELPWHSTLSRTRGLYGEEIFRKLFKKVLSLCVSKKMVGGKRQAIDSAYIKANASLDSLVEKEIMDDVDDFTNELNNNDESQKTITTKKKKEVDSHHKWKEKEYKGQPGDKQKKAGEIDEFGNIIRPKFLSNHTHVSKTDSDARISVKPGKPRQMNYSAQTSVDTKNHVITNILADYSDKRDSQSLKQVIEQTRENLIENNLQLEEILADTGYSSGRALKFLKENNITGYIPNFGQYINTREGFTFNKEQDEYTCSQGKKLTFKKIQTTKYKEAREYRSSRLDCKDCALRSACIGTSFEKKITDSIHKPLYDEMHERLKTEKAKHLKKQRSSTVEPVLGTLINFMGMRRIWTRGIRNANKFMLGAAIAYNIKKYMNYTNKTAKTKVQAMSRELVNRKQGVINTFLRLINMCFCKVQNY